MGLIIRLIGVRTTLGKIKALESSVKNMGAHLQFATSHFVAAVQRNFTAGGRPTVWQRRADGTPSHLKSGKGRLLSGGIHGEVRGNDSIVISPQPLPYARIHQYGGRIPPIFPKKEGGVLRFEAGGKIIFARHTKGAVMPARPYLVMIPEEKERGLKLILTSMKREAQL